MCHVGLLLALAVSLSFLNRAPVSAYFDQSLDVWEQGRFIRFHGLSRWFGILWPYVALGWLLTRLWGREGRPAPTP